MNITRKGVGFELLNSWYILLTFVPFGMTSSIAFLYLWLRTKKSSHLIAFAIYLAGTIGFFYLIVNFPKPDGRPEWFNPAMMGLLALWPISILHSILTRKEFLLRLEALGEKDKANDSVLRSRIRKEMGVSKNPVNDVLVEYTESNLSVRVLKALLNNLPFAPNFDDYSDIEGAVLRLNPDATIDTIRQAEKIAERDEGVLKVTKTGIAIDRIDGGLGIYTGIKNSIDAIKNKDRERTFEADPQQAVDASVKALAIAYIITSLYNGSPAERVRQFAATKAGQEALIYFAAAEVALPFTDNLAEASGDWMSKLFAATGDRAEDQFQQFAQGESIEMAKGVLQSLLQNIDGILSQTRTNLRPFLDKTQQVLPSIMNVTDSVTGGAATALDLLPIWKLLCARIAAEACARKAMQ